MVLSSASELLLVEEPLLPPVPRRRSRHLAAACVLLVCLGGAAYLIASRSTRLAAKTPAAWFQRYAHASRQTLRLDAVTRHRGSAALRIEHVRSGRVQTLLLQRAGGVWTLVGSEVSRRA